MTLKTLKQKANNLLMLDDEFLEYCKINDIEDIEKLAREVFKRGFDIVKYGSIPLSIISKTERSKNVESGVYVQPMTTGFRYTDKGELTIGDPKKVEKNTLYDE